MCMCACLYVFLKLKDAGGYFASWGNGSGCVQCRDIIKLELMIPTIPNEYVNNSALFFRDVTLLCLCIFYIILRVCDKN